MAVSDDWFRSYAELALRLDRAVRSATGEVSLIYREPSAWQERVAAEPEPAPADLVVACQAVRRELPLTGPRAAFVAAQLAAMSAVAERLNGADRPFLAYASRCLGTPLRRVPEDELAAAHQRLAAALPPGPGSLADRLLAWRQAHLLPAERVIEFAHRAIAATVARTRELVPLPEALTIDVELDPGAHRGHYEGGSAGTIFLSNSQPFNGADLLNIVAHEGFPGHIAESLLKEPLNGREPEHAIRFLPSPPFVVSEGIGLHAQYVIFPDDQAQRWLTDQVFVPLGRATTGDFAAIHRARDALWGAWVNAAILAAEGSGDGELGGYLRRWALLSEAEAAWAVTAVRSPAMGAYVLGYQAGHRLVGDWLDRPDRTDRFRRLLTEPTLPGDLGSRSDPADDHDPVR
ncbi:hypothetical protein [Microlunatus parietis]|uniref:DUF885 domain-containing protein n=1 Tax=Microlunatus parietis TaxID=682979 RepID=A0A7Y9ICL5_9ACTN|nr:hypothetical protein [Microlunatus parietis]NYE74138.1 hypothetical protein [Microlunatus parietis]